MSRVAHAPKRAVLALLRTQVFEKTQGVHTSVNAVRLGAYATKILILGTFTACLFAQEGGQVDNPDKWLGWQWANFAILAVGLGYLIRKNAPAFFKQRSEEIQQGIFEATQAKNDAQSRAAAIELRLKGLDKEIESLRANALAEITAEGERIRRDTEQRLQKIQQQGAQEIALMSRGARDELRNFSADLALGLAQQRIRSRMNPEVQNALVDGFLQDLRSAVTPGARN